MTRSDEGSTGIELVLSFPLIVLAFFYIVYAGRVGLARLEIDDAAHSAARAAATSLQANAARAAESAATSTVTERGVVCRDLVVDVDLADHRPDGTTTVSVTCTVKVSDLALLGVPGTKTLTARFTEPISKYVATT